MKSFASYTLEMLQSLPMEELESYTEEELDTIPNDVWNRFEVNTVVATWIR